MPLPLKRYWALLSHYLRPQALRVALLAGLLLSTIALQLVSPQILRYYIDTARAGSALSALTAAALSFLGAAVAGQALSIGVTYLGEVVAWTATNALRSDLTLHVLRLDMPFHKAHTPGELIDRIDGDVTRLANFFSQMAVHLLGNGLLALGILGLLLREELRVGLVGVAYALLIVTVLRAAQRPTVRAWGESRQAEAELLGYLGERLAGTEDIRANGGVAYLMARLYRLMRTVFHRWLRAKLISGLAGGLGTLATLGSTVAALAIGAVLYQGGEMTIGAVYLVMHYIGQLQSPLDRIRRQADDLQQAGASIERVEELLAVRPQVTERPRAALPSGPLSVAFEGVTFAYDDGPQSGDGQEADASGVLRDVTFELCRGRVLGLLGRTGGGKTTLTRLLFRLYDPAAGTIRLDGIDLRDLALSGLRRRVGLVTQEVQLFRASVRHNLTLFGRQVSDQQILEALRQLGLKAWYDALPQGLDTELQAGGKSLSAGEAQLLALTRVFLADPGLVILDEASSRLDPATEALLEGAVDRLLRERTAVVIAHRLPTVERADEVMILEEGRVVEHGPRRALAADPGSRFSALLRTGLAKRAPWSAEGVGPSLPPCPPGGRPGS